MCLPWEVFPRCGGGCVSLCVIVCVHGRCRASRAGADPEVEAIRSGGVVRRAGSRSRACLTEEASRSNEDLVVVGDSRNRSLEMPGDVSVDPLRSGRVVGGWRALYMSGAGALGCE